MIPQKVFGRLLRPSHNSLRYYKEVWKVSKYGVIQIRSFSVFSRFRAEYEPEKTPYLDTFHAVQRSVKLIL